MYYVIKLYLVDPPRFPGRREALPTEVMGCCVEPSDLVLSRQSSHSSSCTTTRPLLPGSRCSCGRGAPEAEKRGGPAEAGRGRACGVAPAPDSSGRSPCCPNGCCTLAPAVLGRAGTLAAPWLAACRASLPLKSASSPADHSRSQRASVSSLASTHRSAGCGLCGHSSPAAERNPLARRRLRAHRARDDAPVRGLRRMPPAPPRRGAGSASWRD